VENRNLVCFRPVAGLDFDFFIFMLKEVPKYQNIWPFNKKYTREFYFVDKSSIFPVDLIVNGDFIDFRTIQHRPDGQLDPYGLPPTKKNSEWKISWICNFHPHLFHSLAKFVLHGNRLHIVSGNHDLEFNFIAVRRVLRNELFKYARKHSSDIEKRAFYKRITIYRNHYFERDLFYCEHGHMYDPFCSLPEERTLIHDDKTGDTRLLLPFGDLSSKYLSNALGYFNPYDVTSFFLTIKEYFKLFFKYSLFSFRSMPLRWVIGSIKTLIHIWKDLRVIKIRKIHTKNLAISISLDNRKRIMKLRREAASFNIPLIFRILHLDKLLIGMIVILSILLPFVHSWLLLFSLLLIPAVIAFFNIQNRVKKMPRIFGTRMIKTGGIIQKILKVPYVILSHTHIADILETKLGVVVDTGTWAPIFKDREGKIPWKYGNTFFHIHTDKKGHTYQFKKWNGSEVVEFEKPIDWKERAKS
jgi:hypothetical protein